MGLGGVDWIEDGTDEGPKAGPREEVRQQAEVVGGVRQKGADRVAAAEKHDVARSVPHQDGREPEHRVGG